MNRQLIPALAVLATLSLAGLARAQDGWYVGAGSSMAPGGAPQTSIGLAFESKAISALSFVVRGDYDFENSAKVYRSGVFGLRLRGPWHEVGPWLEAGVGLGGNATTSDGGVAGSLAIGATAATSLAFEPFAEARVLHIQNTPGASELIEFRLGGQFRFRGEEE
jgi:hypothetical protein